MAKRWKTCFDLRANLISTKVSASHRKSTQVHASTGQTVSQVAPSFQLASTCDSVCPGLKIRVLVVAVVLLKMKVVKTELTIMSATQVWELFLMLPLASIDCKQAIKSKLVLFSWSLPFSLISHFRVLFFLCVKTSLHAKTFIWKCFPPPRGSVSCKSDSFSYERFYTKTRFETEPQGNSKMAYCVATDWWINWRTHREGHVRIFTDLLNNSIQLIVHFL